MAVAAGSSILGAVRTIEQVISDGNELISQANNEFREKKIIPYHCNLAPCYGQLKDSFEKMDNELKVIITATTNVLSKMIEDAALRARARACCHTQQNQNDIGTVLSWDNVIAALSTNPVLEPMDDAGITRTDKLIKDNMNYFKISGSPEDSIVREVHTWFVQLISDPDVLKDTGIDIEIVAKIVAQSGATITDVGTLFYKREYHETQVMDIGVLRYPDIEHPYFKVYRIQLTAWSDCSRVLFAQHDCNGITGVYNARKYKPRQSVIAKISREVEKKAVDEAERIIMGL